MSELNPPIKLKIEGNKIPQNKFRIAVESFFDLVDEISISVIGKRSKTKWLVSVKSGSAEIHISPDIGTKEADFIPRIATVLNNGIEEIYTAGIKPILYSDKALECVRQIAESIDTKEEYIKGISISINGKETPIPHDIRNNIDALLQIKKEEYGSVEGRLDLISSRKGYHFFITDDFSNHPIKCDFPENMKKRILDSFNNKVYVFGLIKYRKGNVPYSIQLQHIKPFKDQNKLPTADDVYGLLKGIN